jgi:hypothetical protein
MERTDTVEGRWPFPEDMLRHDQARPATEDDALMIKLLCGDAIPGDRESLVRVVRVTLVMESGDPLPSRPQGRWLPNDKRWRSFGWSVVDVPEITAEREMEAQLQMLRALRVTGLAKLTHDEKRALGLLGEP